MSTQTGTEPVLPVSQTEPDTEGRRFKYYDLCMAAFVTLLLCANVIGAAKLTTVAGITFGAGILSSPGETAYSVHSPAANRILIDPSNEQHLMRLVCTAISVSSVKLS